MKGSPQISVGIAVMASKPHAPDNPEYKEAFLLENKKIDVMGYFYSAETFVEKYPEVNPATNVVIFCGGVRYNTVAEFMTWYDTLNLVGDSL